MRSVPTNMRSLNWLAHTERAFTFAILPEVMAAMVYVFLVRLWSIWLLCTSLIPGPGIDTIQLINTNQYISLSIINTAFCIAFIFAGLRSRRSHDCLRKGHFAGLLIGGITIALLQYGLYLGHLSGSLYWPN